ncbi:MULTISPECIES: anti-sigma factor [Winogradskyella]|uniref:RNA polymerase subunit sigma-70 n=1 Tax=Winogradskyella ouciana TaxID=2608631 RepID=A0A7K1GC52_9FLAO|nr:MULTISPECIES: anti-sigma factor [Winogradskyella]MBO6879021.1 anti-sigma factor [Winogradskyella sp.]MTE26635.1 RNA polymerase subunit sigma-70 [Winogradskyella ouciana]
METKLHSFLNSNLLNKYLVGETSSEETKEVEYYINNFPEAAKAYDKLQYNLELIAKAGAVDVPKNVLANILDALEESNDTKVIQLVQNRKTPWYSIAASAAAILFAVTSFMLYQKNQNLSNENNVVVDEIFDLRSDIENNNAKLDELSRELNKLNDPDARKYVINGNDRAKDLKTVAYINPVEKTSMIDVITLPKLPKDQHYEIWAELQDRMVNLGILDESDRKLRPIPYMEDALALSIKIGNKGDANNTTDTEVAEVSLKEKE